MTTSCNIEKNNGICVIFLKHYRVWRKKLHLQITHMPVLFVSLISAPLLN